MKWRSFFEIDIVPRLIGSADLALSTQSQRALLDEAPSMGPVHGSKPVLTLLRKQGEDGRWRFRSPRTVVPSLDNNDQVETYRSLGLLIELYGLDSGHEAIRKAAEFVLAHQTEEGDIRGIYGHQYTPNYTAGFLELFAKAGMAGDERVRLGLEWLLSARQEDGGWAVPLRTRGVRLDAAAMRSPPVQADLTRPSSQMATGVVLRAFACHPEYRSRREVMDAARRFKTCILKKDAYPDRGGVEYWERCSFPFWFTDAVSALDTLTQLDFSASDPDVRRTLEWLRGRQRPDGTFKLHPLCGAHRPVEDWLAFAVARSARRAFSDARHG